MILVLAGNHHQYMQWIKKHSLNPSDARYVCRPEHYLGLKDCEFVMVGEYYNNPFFGNPHFEAYAKTHGFKRLTKDS